MSNFAADLTGARWCWGACDGLFVLRKLGAPSREAAAAQAARLALADAAEI
jgi:hypothetical protein